MTRLGPKLVLLSLCGGLAPDFAACTDGARGSTSASSSSSTSAAPNPGGSGPKTKSAPSNEEKPCTALNSAERTADDVRARAKSMEKGDGKIDGSRLEEFECGSAHGMRITNGYVGTTYYLRDGVVIGESYGTDYGEHSCSGEIPKCK